jgi:tetratricopeptide (TPR) repeat protein
MVEPRITFRCWTGPSLVTLCMVLMFCVTISHGQMSREFREGLDAANAGKLDAAIERWTRAIERNPASYAAYANRGSAYLQSGHVFNAVMDWHNARKLSPLFAYGLYGGLFIPEVSRNPAMLNYAMAMELDPDHVASVCMTGSLYLDLGHLEKASALYRKSIDLTRNPLLKSHLEYWVDTLSVQPGN